MATGRRRGSPGTREEILGAARAEFAEEGYDRASVRAIARRAAVDPALVYHYFDGKAALFVELLDLARDPQEIMASAAKAGPARGARIVEGFLEAWGDGDGAAGTAGARFVTAMQAVSASPEAAVALREFMMERVWSRHPGPDSDDTALRRALVAAQLMGVAWQRYVLRLEPLASATTAQVGAWVGPTIEQYLSGPIGG